MNSIVSTDPRDGIQYEEFYGFVQSPFTLAPDPRFLYLSASHDEALRRLLQAIGKKEGLAVLTGDIGTGKTTLCRTVLERLDMTSFTSLVLNPFLSVDELLREALVDFGVVSRDAARSGRLAAASTHELVTTLHEFLASLTPIGGKGVLIIDEAQHLSPQVLDELRELSNLETNHTKLLQIVLVGQLNLLTALDAPQNDLLAERVSLRVELSPLSREDVEGYITHRLSISHGSSSVTFDPSALDLLHSASAGVPRVINLLCDRALMFGARFGLRVITADIISEAAHALGYGPETSRSRMPSPRWLAAGAAVLLMLGALAMYGPFALPDLPLLSRPASHPAAPSQLPTTAP
ncbi:MAG TPA: AAA family ATPase [Vicinamibacterales bacterium]|nr:AAA family ATPase [Vicinamibacterales bacterium]